jgi:dehydrogenase/reductase SDR family protein 7B
MNRRPFEGKVVWITGASSGIGRALALAFGREGARLILSARAAPALESVRAECGRPGEVKILPLDLQDLERLAVAAASAEACFGRVDIMVHNAGVAHRDRVTRTPLSIDQQLMAVNYFGAVALTKALLPGMLARHEGRFVVISSLSGKYGGPLLSAYAAPKHALYGFFESLRAEEHAAGIRVTMVVPGFIRTAITEHALTGTGERYGRMLQVQAEGMTPERCAERILRAVERDREEVLVGRLEIATVYLWRWFPGLMSRVIRSHPVRFRNRLRRLLPWHR